MSKFIFERVDFSNLDTIAKAQVSQIYRGLEAGGKAYTEKIRLLALLREHAYKPELGYYVPFSQTVTLPAKNSEHSKGLGGNLDWFVTSNQRLQFFTNPLALVERLQPRHRLINAGFLIVTVECDSTDPHFMNEQLEWLRGETSKVMDLDRRLAAFREYRGVTAVHSGKESVHLHFHFSTEHLHRLHDPQSSTTDEIAGHAIYITNVYHQLWDLVVRLFEQIITPSVAPDRKLRSPTQFRRLPFGRRRSGGQFIDQIVLLEISRSRAAPGASEFAVSPNDTSSDRRRAARRSYERQESDETLFASDLIAMMQDDLRLEFGEYPKPVRSEKRDGDHWIFFQNDANDKNPSGFVGGEVRKLTCEGRTCEKRKLFLPDGMNANEYVQYITRLLNRESTPSATYESDFESKPGFKTASLFSRPGRPPFLREIRGPKNLSRQSSISDARKRLAEECFHIRGHLNEGGHNTDVLIVGPEGSGKTSIHFPIVALEAIDSNMGSGSTRNYTVIATRSYDQANEKMEEFNRKVSSGPVARTIKSFYVLYEEACAACGAQALERDELDDLSNFNERLAYIKDRQPTVFERLVREREGGSADLDPARTIFAMPHALAYLWNSSIGTRAWFNPSFEIFESDPWVAANQMKIANILHDEVENDSLVLVIREDVANEFGRLRAEHPDWTTLPMRLKRSIFANNEKARWLLKKSGDSTSFHRFSELMAVDFAALQPVLVDYDAMPYGTDNTTAGMYRKHHGERYLIGSKANFSDYTRCTFLTTEELPAAILRKQYRDNRRLLCEVRLSDIPGITPIEVPLEIDKRANREGRPKLVNELRSDGFEVICHGENAAAAGAINFQKAKGRNDLAEKDIAIVLTHYSDTQYARLNAIGMWLGRTDTLLVYRQDQINQSVGRNRGFRLKDGTRTKVISTARVFRQELSRLSGGRTQLIHEAAAIRRKR